MASVSVRLPRSSPDGLNAPRADDRDLYSVCKDPQLVRTPILGENAYLIAAPSKPVPRQQLVGRRDVTFALRPNRRHRGSLEIRRRGTPCL